MKRKFRRRQWKGLLPRSSEILGALARLCEWQPTRSARERTWRKFCQGEHIDGNTCRAILEEMVESLVRKMGPAPSTPEEVSAQARDCQGLSLLLILHATHWDVLCQRLQEALPAQPSAFTTTVALRLAVVEVAMRFVGMLQLHGQRLEFPADLGERPVDVHRLLLPYVLRAVLKEADITRLELAEALDVSKEAVDQWLESTAIIPPERIDDIVEVIAEAKKLDASAVAMGLRALRKLSQALMPLVDLVGEDELGRLLLGLLRLMAAAQTTLQEQMAALEDGARKEALGALIAAGGESPLGAVLREALLKNVPDEPWRRAIATPPGEWMQFLADASATETVYARIGKFFTEQGFPMPEQEREQLHHYVLLPRDSPEHPYAALFALPPEQRGLAYVAHLWEYFQSVSSRMNDPETVQRLGMLQEVCGLLVEISRGDVKELAEELRWRCHGLFILGCMGIGRDHLDSQNTPEMKLWSERMLKALRGLPPFPEQVWPETEPILRVLRLLKQSQEEIDAGKMPTVKSADFDFVHDLKLPAPTI